ncbi:rRNA maturation RNase YbeY [Candidatus Kaiserbacteria bacterium]|nr:rRNA maturation RNase YbeY [Candidatus Kaiserbacteria bacterium]
MRRSPSVEVRNMIRGTVPRIPFEKIARKILGRHYQLSLVICGDSLAKKMNRAYRKKTYAANVLSFPLDKNEGETFLNIHAARREAKIYDVSLRARLTLLFVHACLHLKGMRHGQAMERKEQQFLKLFV